MHAAHNTNMHSPVINLLLLIIFFTAYIAHFKCAIKYCTTNFSIIIHFLFLCEFYSSYVTLEHKTSHEIYASE